MGISQKEYAQLRAESIIEQIQERSGLSVDELKERTQADIDAARQRMFDLRIILPEVKHPDVKLTRHLSCGGDYKAVRRLSGKGMGQKAAIGLYVMTNAAIESDGKLWYHVSVTRMDKTMPSYTDIAWVKDLWFPDGWAMQFFPTQEQHVTDHNTCLHLWRCLEDFPMPDFRKYGSI